MEGHHVPYSWVAGLLVDPDRRDLRVEEGRAGRSRRHIVPQSLDHNRHHIRRNHNRLGIGRTVVVVVVDCTVVEDQAHQDTAVVEEVVGMPSVLYERLCGLFSFLLFLSPQSSFPLCVSRLFPPQISLYE